RKRIRVGDVERARVFHTVELHQAYAFVEGCSREPLAQGGSALVRLDDDVDGRDAVEVLGPLVAPARGSGKPERGKAVVPERLAVALPLDHHHEPCRPGLADAGEPVQAWLGAAPPPEPRAAVERTAEAHSHFDTTLVEVGHANAGCADVSVGEPASAQEVDW